MTFRHLRNVRGFFSDYYLGSVFGRGDGRGRKRKLSGRESAWAYGRFRRMRERAEGQSSDAAACRERFLRPLFRDLLGFHLGEGDDRIHPLHLTAEAEAAGKPPLLLAYCGGWADELDAGQAAAHPSHRIEAALARTGVAHGVIATGERLRLVCAPGEGPKGAFLEVDLEGLGEEEDPESFAAFLLLFSAQSFIADADGKVAIEEIERESRQHAEKVSEDLKAAVFTAAETLAGGLIADAVASRHLPSATGLTDSELRLYRDAALTALYRILFILYAEARDPRLEEHRLYRDAYSAQGLVEELANDPSRDWPENRSGLWARLRALFRIYDRGLPAITPWQNIPPRGGDFFSAETADGRILDQSRLSDHTVARLVLDLATTSPRHGIGRERVSFRELDIESLGAVYEGLLEFEPRVAAETTVEVRVQGRTFALRPADLVRLCEEKALALKGEFHIVAGTPAESLHPDAGDEDEEGTDGDPEGAEASEDGEGGADQPEEAGVKKGAAALLVRRLEPGTFHFVAGAARKGSGSFYTPRLLVDDLVRHALGPLVEGRSSCDIERLRVLDPACGSAHFLVNAMRFLGQALHRACVEEHRGGPPPQFRSTTGLGWDDNWRAPDEEARAANSEARAWCKRRIAERCLFGVDRNPTAVVLARVALWIESAAGDRPLTYFSHHIRCGNSLTGTWLDRLDQPPLPDMASAHPGQLGLFQGIVKKAVGEAARIRHLIDQPDAAALDREGIEPDTLEEHAFKERQRQRADEILRAVKLLFSLRSASAFIPDIWADWLTLCGLVDAPDDLTRYAGSRAWWHAFAELQDSERFFHWELEFPEVFLDGRRTGFDAVLGNPPWDKVLPSKLEFYGMHDVLVRAYRGDDLDRRIRELHEADPCLPAAFGLYRSHTTRAAQLLRQGGDFPLSEARSQSAHEDLSKYFVDRAARLAGTDGRVGFLVPSVVYNGDGCVGIRRFLLTGTSIERFYGFENRRRVFQIDSRYKFVSLVFRKELPAGEAFGAAFMRHDLSELADDGPKPWNVTISRAEIERLSPETFAFLEYRGPRDQAIVGKMYASGLTLGSDAPGSWGVALISWRVHNGIYNASEDRDLWTDPLTGRVHTPESVLGEVPPDHGAVMRLMSGRGFWPVFEGKHVDQFLVGIKPVRWWLSVAQAEAKYGKKPRAEATLVFRETARNTDERTCIAAVLPPQSAGSHKLTGVLLEHVEPDAAMAVLNSLCFDYALRQRTAGTNISFTYIRPVPVPPAAVVNRLPRIATQLAWERGIEHISDDESLWPALWAGNRAVAEAYGLSPDDFEHILASFPVLARKRPTFVAYLRQRLSDWRESLE